LPIVAGVGAWSLRFGAGGCNAFAAGGTASIEGDVQWEDATGHVVGYSHVAPQPYDLRGANLTVDRRSGVLPGQVLALRLAVDPTACASTRTSAAIASTHGRTTSWIPGA
jgi:hypothetical protein